MGTCILGFDNFYLIWLISFSEHVLHVHFIKLKKAHECQSVNEEDIHLCNPMFRDKTRYIKILTEPFCFSIHVYCTLFFTLNTERSILYIN